MTNKAAIAFITVVVALFAIVVVLSLSARKVTQPPPEAVELSEAFLKRIPATPPPALLTGLKEEEARAEKGGGPGDVPIDEKKRTFSMDYALFVQWHFTRLITEEYGHGLGYKVALTNPVLQERLGAAEPIRGYLLEDMLTDTGDSGDGANTGDTLAVLDPGLGTRPMLEADIIVIVESTDINKAETPEEMLPHIGAIVPFIEIPDLVFSEDVVLTAPLIASINAGARGGVLGKAILLTDYPETDWHQRLKDFTVEVFDEDGKSLAKGRGRDLMEGPLNALMWLRDSLKRDSKKLKRGDVVSLGSLTDMLPVVVEGKTIRAVYTGLHPKGPIEVRVRFTEEAENQNKAQ